MFTTSHTHSSPATVADAVSIPSTAHEARCDRLSRAAYSTTVARPLQALGCDLLQIVYLLRMELRDEQGTKLKVNCDGFEAVSFYFWMCLILD